MLKMRMLRMRKVCYLPVQIYRLNHVWNITLVPKFCIFQFGWTITPIQNNGLINAKYNNAL